MLVGAEFQRRLGGNGRGGERLPGVDHLDLRQVDHLSIHLQFEKALHQHRHGGVVKAQGKAIRRMAQAADLVDAGDEKSGHPVWGVRGGARRAHIKSDVVFVEHPARLGQKRVKCVLAGARQRDFHRFYPAGAFIGLRQGEADARGQPALQPGAQSAACLWNQPPAEPGAPAQTVIIIDQVQIGFETASLRINQVKCALDAHLAGKIDAHMGRA